LKPDTTQEHKRRRKASKHTTDKKKGGGPFKKKTIQERMEKELLPISEDEQKISHPKRLKGKSEKFPDGP